MDPLLADPAGGNYHLLPESPCIDAGNPAVGYNDPEDPNNLGFALYPAMGTIINDIGTYGGSGSGNWVSNQDEEVPVNSNVILHQNYPNPFNPTTEISFSLTTEPTESTEIEIYNIKGQKVKTFTNLSISQSPNCLEWHRPNK